MDCLNSRIMTYDNVQNRNSQITFRNQWRRGPPPSMSELAWVREQSCSAVMWRVELWPYIRINIFRPWLPHRQLHFIEILDKINSNTCWHFTDIFEWRKNSAELPVCCSDLLWQCLHSTEHTANNRRHSHSSQAAEAADDWATVYTTANN